MTRIQLLALCLRVQCAYQVWLAQRRRDRHNSKRVTLRSHRENIRWA
jgi:hypothetical protein